MIENANVRYILISYNNEGLLTTERLKNICQEYAVNGSFKLYEIDYRRYNNVGTTPGGVMEQLYFFEK
jgi:adenine-specific DNA-methyltransferase